jgi:choline kinase
MEVIVPAAGLSSRFAGMKPKYLLYDYKHDLMLKNAIAPYLGKYRVTIGILKEHNDAYNAELYIKNDMPEVNVVVLKKQTKGPADTVYQILRSMKVNPDDGLLIKDCDSFFDHEVTDNSYICTSNIADHKILKNLSAKSFVISNNQDIITNIIEKNVVSDSFCVGAYKFEKIRMFVDGFNHLSTMKNEIFVSHVIQHCLISGYTFVRKNVSNYIDVGTAEDWFEYNDKPVIFCDIDGTIVKAQGRYGKNSFSDKPEVLVENVKRLKELEDRGAQIIFTTARPSEFIDTTNKLIEDLGFKNYSLLIGLNATRRILINDYNNSNPFPRAEAINIRRDSDNLKDFI